MNELKLGSLRVLRWQIQKLLKTFSNVSGNFGRQGVCYDSFLLGASITTEEILAPLPPFDPTGSKKKQIQEKRILYH